MVAPWPEAGTLPRDEDAERRLSALQELVTSVRSLRKEYGVPEGQDVTVLLAGGGESFQRAVDGQSAQLDRMARVSRVRWERAVDGTIGAHAVLTNGVELFLPLEGVIDLDQERDRLRREIERLREQLAGTEKKLANEQFVTKAPGDVVEREREKGRSQREQMEKLQEKLDLFEGRG